MVLYETLYEDVKNKLSEKRFNHSKGVVERAIEYAKIYNIDLDIVKLCAIAHDIAKEIPKDKIIDVARSLNYDLDSVEKENLSLPHAKLGAEICKKEYGFTEEMVNAVRYHTTGKENMTTLEKIIYLADATEPNRKYSDLEYYVNLCITDIDRAMFEVSKWCLEYVLKEGKVIHLDSVKCYNYYKKVIENR